MSLLDILHTSRELFNYGSDSFYNINHNNTVSASYLLIPNAGEPDPIQTVGPQRVFTTQLVLTTISGLFLFILFCIMRYRWPHIYAVRTLRQQSKNILKPLPNNLFGWMKVVYKINDEDILTYSGLDSYVYLAFFKMGIKIFFVLTIFSILVLSPFRYYFTGDYDKENIPSIINLISILKSKPNRPPDFNDDFPKFLWVYPIFTYLFSFVVFYYLYDFTDIVLKTRQKYLASQNSITDRTIKLDGIPKKLLSREKIKKFIEDLGIGKVEDVKLIYNWTPLQLQFDERKHLVLRLEYLYASEYELDIDIFNQQRVPAVNPIWTEPTGNEYAREEINTLSKQLTELNGDIKLTQGKFDTEASTINAKQHPEFSVIPSAFITMDSVASAQMAAQTILDPRVYKLIVSLAPAPKDIIWNNLKLTYGEKLLKSYMITFLIVLSYGFIIFLVIPLTSLLDLKTITKFWPALGELIGRSDWLTTFVTGILPPLLFTLLNISFPYFYRYLSELQGYSTNSEIELSTLSKNFFFIFFNLFLIYVAAGTFWDYMSYISDTTKIATQLATSLRRMSLFYVDLILLQGLTMFPVKLLQIGDFFLLNILGKVFFIKTLILRTPRDYRSYYYTPQVFDFGINLPQHIMIFMIILIYSVVSTKIVTCGLIYFIIGLFVYKYQLVYNFVHPPHSTGKVWPMIFRRVILGLIIFQLFMCGTLALESAILLSILCTPTILVTICVLYNFEKYYVPLNDFIALRAILNPYNFDKVFDNDDVSFTSGENSNPSSTNSSAILDDNEHDDEPIDESSCLLGQDDVESRYVEPVSVEQQQQPISSNTTKTNKKISRRKSTIDEDREQFTDYTYPPLVDPLNGPWVGFTGNIVSMVEYQTQTENILGANTNNGDTIHDNGDTTIVSTTDRETIINKRLTVSEWE
ncbi:hypothetical protein KGF54_004090 [Candida jiufengensis]|uniref:uncharacterized protein n=1 Tax=Candida jiufengensis TaxID=497108 RepID=UPI002224A963|nr:uncharacterized protein KGF54_004090 [Candida jiufengensis]KAI5951016.1 hypothetical protein KGF54_004090 [Candida jiufengensis]